MGKVIKVKARFNASRGKFEKFGDGMYLAYLDFPEDNDSTNVIASLIARQIGVPGGSVEFAGKDMHGNLIFEVM
ncbi:MAG: hypothetical protein AABX11_03595 [Nanoarchaeota archaeon]